MAFDVTFLTETLSGEGEVGSKVQKIIAEYEADVKGLKITNSDLKAEKQKAADRMAELEKANSEFDKQISELSEKVKKAGSEDAKAFYDAQLEKLSKEHQATVQKLTKERDAVVDRVTNLMGISEFDKALEGEDGVALPIRSEMRGALRDLLYTRHKFERKEIDKAEMLLTSENKTVKDVLTAYLSTPEGKYFLVENSSGGGAGGSSSSSSSGKNPWKKETMNLTEQSKLVRENPTLAARYKAEAGVK